MQPQNTNINLYGYDLAGQLTNEVLFTSGLSARTTNTWVYDEAGNWLGSLGSAAWRGYNADNELAGATTNTVTVTGEVEPGPQSNILNLYAPTNASAMPTKFDLALGQLLGYEHFSNRSKAHLRHTEHPNALPASWRCPGEPRASWEVLSLSTPISLSVMAATALAMSCDLMAAQIGLVNPRSHPPEP